MTETISLKISASLLTSSIKFWLLLTVQTAILLDLARDEVLRESRQAENNCAESDGLPPWASHALELVELILRPPQGGPPCLPDHSEQVHFLLLVYYCALNNGCLCIRKGVKNKSL